jgi:hypothetical protein
MAYFDLPPGRLATICLTRAGAILNIASIALSVRGDKLIRFSALIFFGFFAMRGL